MQSLELIKLVMSTLREDAARIRNANPLEGRSIGNALDTLAQSIDVLIYVHKVEVSRLNKRIDALSEQTRWAQVKPNTVKPKSAKVRSTIHKKG